MTQPRDLPDHHARRYLAARDAQTKLALQYLTSETGPELSLAATACHRALQFERQAQAIEELAGDLRRIGWRQPATGDGLHAALSELIRQADYAHRPYLQMDTLRNLLTEHQP